MADLTDYPDLHRRESPEKEQELRKVLFTSFAQADALDAMFEGFEVRPGTALAGDDAATPYESVSQHLRTYVGVALDNLKTVRLIIQDARTVPMSSHFGLLRNALEAVGVATWVVGPGPRDLRVLRSLQLSWENRKDIYGLEATMQGTSGRLPADDPIVLRLQEIRDARPPLRGVSLKPPTITNRLHAAQSFTAPYDFPLLVAWKLTSGIAHGRRSAMYHLLDREVMSTDERGARVNMTSSFGAVAGLYRVSLHYLMQLLVITLGRNGTPPSF
jgi:hypothetical protein